MSASEHSELAIALFPVFMTGLLVALRCTESRSGEFIDGTYRYIVVWVNKSESPIRFKIHRFIFDIFIVLLGFMSIVLTCDYIFR